MSMMTKLILIISALAIAASGDRRPGDVVEMGTDLLPQGGG